MKNSKRNIMLELIATVVLIAVMVVVSNSNSYSAQPIRDWTYYRMPQPVRCTCYIDSGTTASGRQTRDSSRRSCAIARSVMGGTGRGDGCMSTTTSIKRYTPNERRQLQKCLHFHHSDHAAFVDLSNRAFQLCRHCSHKPFQRLNNHRAPPFDAGRVSRGRAVADVSTVLDASHSKNAAFG